jgi:hypothetical protein
LINAFRRYFLIAGHFRALLILLRQEIAISDMTV